MSNLNPFVSDMEAVKAQLEKLKVKIMFLCVLSGARMPALSGMMFVPGVKLVFMFVHERCLIT